MCGVMAAAATVARWITVVVLCVSIRCAVGLRGACFHRQRGVNGCSGGGGCRSTSAWASPPSSSSPPPPPSPPRSSPARTAPTLHTAARNPTLSLSPPSTLPKKTFSRLPRQNQDHHHHHHRLHPRRARVRLRGGAGNHDGAHESLLSAPEPAPHSSQGVVGRRASSDDTADGRAGGLSPGRYRLRLHHHHHRHRHHPPSRQNRQSRLRLRAVERSEVVEPMVESGAGLDAGVLLGEQVALGGVAILSLTDVHTVTDVVTDGEKFRPTVDAPLGRGRVHPGSGAGAGAAAAAASGVGSASSLRWGAMVASPAAAAAVAVVEAASTVAAAAGVEGVVVGAAAPAAGVEAAETAVLGAPVDVGAAEGVALGAAEAVATVVEGAVVAAVGEAEGVVVEAGVVAVAASRQGRGGPRREEDAGQEEEQEQEREDERFMRMALRLAERAGKAGEVPVGAVLTESVAGGGGVDVGGGRRRRRVLATGRNDVERRKDASAHAEMLCLQAAAKARRNWRLGGGTLYVTMEPCVMCLSAAQLFRVDRVVFGAPNPNLGACGGWIDLPGHKHAFHELEIRGGVLAEECALPLRGFFRSRRREGAAPGKRSSQAAAAAGSVGGVARGGGDASGAAIPEGESCSHRPDQILPVS